MSKTTGITGHNLDDPAMSCRIEGDVEERLEIRSGGIIAAGSGATAPDTVLRRAMAGAWTLPLPATPGVPNDGYFTSVPPNGTIAVDSTDPGGPVLYIRVGGTWIPLGGNSPTPPPAPGEVLWEDNFNRADSANLGANWVNKFIFGSTPLSISGNKVVSPASDAHTVRDAGQTDHRISVSATNVQAAADLTLFVRSDGSSSSFTWTPGAIAVSFRFDDGTFTVRARQGGSNTIISPEGFHFHGVSAAGSAVFQLEAEGDICRVLVDDVEKLEFTIPSGVQTDLGNNSFCGFGSGFAIGAWPSGMYVDDAVAAVPGVFDPGPGGPTEGLLPTGGAADSFLKKVSATDYDAGWRTPTEVRTDLGLGTSSLLNVPATGDATTTEVVYGTDSRLSDTRTPTDGSVTPPKMSGTVSLTDGATIAVNSALGSIFKVTIAGNRTISNPTNPTAGQKIVIRIKQDATGSRTVTWDTKFRWGTDVTVPTLTTTAGKTDYIGFIYNADDDKWDGVAVAKGY